MDKFKNLIVLGPLIYAIHHYEEHIIFNFIEWKLQYFQHSAAALSTEAILSILTCILVAFALLHLVKNNRASAHVILFMLFGDFSPGAITALVLYLPVNFLIVQAAFKEGYLKSYFEFGCIAFLGTTTFILFEIFGPIIIVAAIIFSLIYFVWFNKHISIS